MQFKTNPAVAFLLAALTFSTVAMLWTGQPESAPSAAQAMIAPGQN